MKIIKKFEDKPNEYQIVTLVQIYQQLNNLNISSIEITDGEIWHINDKKIKFEKNDYNNPIVMEKNDIYEKNYLYINPKWYEENNEQCDALFQYICENINRKKFSINTGEIINTKIIDSLCKNKYLEEITLAEYDEEKYILSVQDYEKFKQSNIKKVNTKEVVDELKENFDPLIGYNERRLISYYNYKDLQEINKISIDKELTKEELENLKYIPTTLEINYNLTDYDFLIKIITKLKELNKGNKLIINTKNKEKFNNWILNNDLDYENIEVNDYPLKEYLRLEKILYDFIKDINHLSPFEKYIYIYNITKKYKPYKENEDDKNESRNLYKILMNEYMVCVGFSNMLGDLLNKQNIENVDLSVTVDLSYDKVAIDEENFEEAKAVQKGYHARRYVHIVDEKYGINGIFIADPTWDNDMEKDLYSHLVMTNKEASMARRYIWTHKSDSEELLNVNSIEEFYQKLNFIISREDNDKTIDHFIRDLIKEYLEKLDSKYINKLKEKYQYIDSYSWPEDINDLIYEVGEYVVNHVNKEISGQTIVEAVSNVYKNAYGYSEEECNIKIQEMINQNKTKYEKAFPKRYKINNDGTKEIIMNEQNKFEIDYEEKAR